MVELSNERLEQILHEETAKTEELATILRSIYTRYMCLYEKYFEDIDALNDDKIAEYRKYQEETEALVKYFYLDIPQDVCTAINEFEKEYGSRLIGAKWHEYVFDSYGAFKENNRTENKSEESIKAEFAKQALNYFYDAMDYVFRESFGTKSETVKKTYSWITGLLFGNTDK